MGTYKSPEQIGLMPTPLQLVVDPTAASRKQVDFRLSLDSMLTLAGRSQKRGIQELHAQPPNFAAHNEFIDLNYDVEKYMDDRNFPQINSYRDLPYIYIYESIKYSIKEETKIQQVDFHIREVFPKTPAVDSGRWVHYPFGQNKFTVCRLSAGESEDDITHEMRTTGEAGYLMPGTEEVKKLNQRFANFKSEFAVRPTKTQDRLLRLRGKTISSLGVVAAKKRLS
jgi:hypothetical protein